MCICRSFIAEIFCEEEKLEMDVILPPWQASFLKGIEVRKNYSVKLPDAIIAATALVHDYTLVTRNASDFKKISGLKLLNPWEI